MRTLRIPSFILTARIQALRAIVFLAALLVLGSLPAQAARFTVSARILCPASVVMPGNPALTANPLVGSVQIDPSFTRSVNVPCAGIRVVAMDADIGFDGFCGAAYTDSGGRVNFRGDCGDPFRPSPEVYLRIEGRSLNGFSVGIIEPNLIERALDQIVAVWQRFVEDGVPVAVPALDQLRTHQTSEWETPWRRVANGASLALGDFAIGMGGNMLAGPQSFMAARQYWATHFTTLRLRAGTRYRPMHFNYTINAPLPDFTSAFTAYDTVVVNFFRNAGGPASVSLNATAHEIGHVLYNTYHSDNLHWVADCLGFFCFRPHALCGGERLKFAWYEGFANFVQDYAYQQWVWPTWTWPPPPAPTAVPPAGPPPLVLIPFDGCAVTGGPTTIPPPPTPPVITGPRAMSFEGNVSGLLNNVFFGPVRPQLLTAANPRSGGLAFLCPNGSAPVPALDGSGALECVVAVPATCDRYADHAHLEIDAVGVADRCRYTSENPRCRNAPPGRNTSCPYDPVVHVGDQPCGGGEIRLPGRDACPVRVPASHTLPNGNPRPRPDGTPDLMLGASATAPGGQAWFALPDLDDVMGWVDETGRAGPRAHRAEEFWRLRIRRWCALPDGLRDRYCNPTRSPSFFGELTALDAGLM
ncbi:MAG: hypothetical protein ACRD2Z_07365 [Thermoanaerobaculia bacterium]